jgi:hypothetical protein
MIAKLALLALATVAAGTPGTHPPQTPEPGVRISIKIVGSGAVVAGPAGHRCVRTCSFRAPRRTKLTLKPVPTAGGRFLGWRGACSGSNSCTFRARRGRFAIARFAVESLSSSGSGSANSEQAQVPADPPTELPAPVLGPKPLASVMFNCVYAPAKHREPVFTQLADAGVAWVRINLDWYVIEPKTPGVYSNQILTALDDCVQQANSAGIKVLIAMTATPPWARTGPDWRSPPKDPRDYARTLTFLANHYAGKVDAWEIWNEENLPMFWTGTAVQYVGLLKAAYPAVKLGDPSALVVFGGTAFNDDGWLAACYAAGAKGFFDVMATHPYQGNHAAPPESPDDGHVYWFTHTPAVRMVMLANGDDKPIWFTESGWSSPNPLALAQQADYLTREYAYTWQNYPYVKNVFWFQAINEVRSVAPDSWEGGLALINPDLSPRPALTALKDFATGS